MKKLLTPLVLSAVLGDPSAFANTATLSQFVFTPHLLEIVGPPDGFSVPSLIDTLASRQFSCPDGSTLILNSVALNLHAEISAKGTLRNKTDTDLSGSVTYTGPITLTVPGGNLTVNQNLTSGVKLVPALGTTRFGPIGNGGDTSGPGTVAAFYGPGSVQLDLNSTIVALIPGGGNIELIYDESGDGAFGSATLDVTYDYTCTEVRVPEPKVYGLIGAALSLGVLGYRQYRSKKA